MTAKPSSESGQYAEVQGSRFPGFAIYLAHYSPSFHIIKHKLMQIFLLCSEAIDERRMQDCANLIPAVTICKLSH